MQNYTEKTESPKEFMLHDITSMLLKDIGNSEWTFTDPITIPHSPLPCRNIRALRFAGKKALCTGADRGRLGI